MLTLAFLLLAAGQHTNVAVLSYQVVAKSPFRWNNSLNLYNASRLMRTCEVRVMLEVSMV